MAICSQKQKVAKKFPISAHSDWGPYMKKIVSSPSEPFLVIRVSQKWSKFLGKIFFQPLDIGFRCFDPKNHENWLYRLGAMAKKPSKTWFFMFFDFLAFLTHPNDQKRFWRARYYFFHVWTPLKKFRQNLGTPSTKVFGPVWIQSIIFLWV